MTSGKSGEAAETPERPGPLATVDGDDIVLWLGRSEEWATSVVRAAGNAEPGDVTQADIRLIEEGHGVVSAARETIAEQLDGNEPTKLLAHGEYHVRFGFNETRARTMIGDLDSALEFGVPAHQLELRLDYETLQQLGQQIKAQVDP